MTKKHFHVIAFSVAVELKPLTDYKLLVLTINGQRHTTDEKQLRRWYYNPAADDRKPSVKG